MRVSIADLRPWEYASMSFWDYERIRHAQESLADARAKLPPIPEEQRGHGYNLPLEEGIGPQLVDEDDPQ